jgi:hypothetical protein
MGVLVVGVVDKVERRKSETSGLQECHVHCMDRSGKDIDIVLSEREAARLYSLLGVQVKR